ncbi:MULTISPECIES: hypothetical protein [unclassified Mesorhizobium]|uniref:hypothetical protein n=1 Tax=unclassified Mesorhizobium TaxID=325217 RepID=UPI00163D85C3|nr:MULTISPECIES: hypothetical protein [unclassified Mesorhizobium]
MTQTGWIHLGILLLVFVGVVAFIFRRLILPAPKESAHGESIEDSSGYIRTGDDGLSHHDGGGHGGLGD